VKEVHSEAREAFVTWRSHGSPREGPMYDMMRNRRAHFKLVLRQCKADSSTKASDSLAKHLLTKDCKTFWKEVKRMQGFNSPGLASTVGGATNTTEICNMWKEHFQSLLNSCKDTSEKENVLEQLSDMSNNCVNRITPENVNVAIKKLKKGKSPGCDNLQSEHYIFASNKLSVLLCIVFNCMIIHSYVPEALLDTIIVPLVKGKKEDIMDKDNYRPIAITCISSKILELTILDKYALYPESNDNQYGFKRNMSTDVCVFTLKEIIDYYKNQSSNVYTCFLDASKAFDKVNHWLLFSRLLRCGVPKLIVRLLMVWYSCQKVAVKWESLSTAFTVTNGVRQGGVLSPVLFNVFIDDLSVQLSGSKIGCTMNNVFFNNLNYADDSVLLAPSPSALQKLLKICEDFAVSNDMTYNVRKTVCVCFQSIKLCNLPIPTVYLNNNALEWKPQHKYLGVLLDHNLKDDIDIRRQLRSIYARGNILIRRFKRCSVEVKCQLFKSYCSSMYCSNLWKSHSVKSLKRIKVAYNNVFRLLLGVTRNCSVSQLFVSHYVDSFTVLQRKLIHSFSERVLTCENVLVTTIVSSMYFTYSSPLCKRWFKLTC
jgi:hypothetical protein